MSEPAWTSDLLKGMSLENIAELYNTKRRRLSEVQAHLAKAQEAIREAYEIYAGSEGFLPETAPEAYQQRLINQMADILGKALTGEEDK